MTSRWYDYVALRIGAFHFKSALCLVSRSWASAGWGYGFNLSQDHLVEGSGKFMGGNSSRYVTTLISLVTINSIKLELVFLICLVASHEHMFKGLCDFMDGNP